MPTQEFNPGALERSAPPVGAIAVRTLDLADPLAPILDVTDYETTRIVVLWNGCPFGSICVANKFQPIIPAQVRAELKAEFGASVVERRAPSAGDAAFDQRPPYLNGPGTADSIKLSSEISASIIVPTYDRPAELRKCLASLVAQVSNRLIEIIVIDNNPLSGLTPPVVHQFPAVKLVRESRQGPSYARNAGINASKGEIVAMIDDDMIAPSNWLEELLAPFARSEVMAVTGNTLPLELETEAQRLYQQWWTVGKFGRGWKSWDADLAWRKSHSFLRTWLIGGSGNAAFRARVFTLPGVGLFEERLEAFEDLYLFYKILKADLTIAYEPRAFAWHRHRRSLTEFQRQLFGYQRFAVAYVLLTLIRHRDWNSLLVLKNLVYWQGDRVLRRLMSANVQAVKLCLAEIAGMLHGPITLWQAHQRVKEAGETRKNAVVAALKRRGIAKLRGSAGQFIRLIKIRLTESEPAQTALIAASRCGNTKLVDTLIDGGADLSARGRFGRTALHEAALNGHPDTAATLLMRGADPGLEDMRGRKPLAIETIAAQGLHAIRQRYHRARSPESHLFHACDQVASWIDQLDRDGIIRISGLISQEQLARLQLDFLTFVENLDRKIEKGVGLMQHYDEEEHFWAKDRAYVTNNAFKYSPELVRLCCRSELVQAMNLYLGKRAYVQRGVGMRYLPFNTDESDMFGWHHDMEEKRLKIMILLSDVTDNDQYMSYVRGSQRLFHPVEMFLQNQCSLQYCRRHLPHLDIFRATGIAGDVFLFDSNGAHRGNRRETGAIRDAFFVEYTSDRSEIWGGDFAADLPRQLCTTTINPFELMQSVQKKWDRPITRTAPTWIENLPDVASWL